MGMEDNWLSFVEMTKAKADSHGKVAQYWDMVHNVVNLVLIFLASLTTLTTLLPIHKYVPATLGALTTLMSAVSGFMAPSNRRQAQMESSRAFRALMLKMIRCETEREYEGLWKDYNKELLGEPFLPKKYRQTPNTNFTMSPEFSVVVKQKQAEVAEAIGNLEAGMSGTDSGNKNATGMQAAEGVEKEEVEDHDEVGEVEKNIYLSD